ncbi:MAG: hypothetical protein Q9217_000014 [Psora testacea]
MAHSTTPQSSSKALDPLLSQSVGGMRTMEFQAACCCGRSQCAYLEDNNAALEGLEKDLQSVAQIGQALLARHEAYMAEAEEERQRMGDTISRLEKDKKELEVSNAKTIEENRYLLDQLEQLNNNVSDSDAHIQMLNATLKSTRMEMSKMAALAAQTSQLEAQLSAMEAEQAKLQNEVVSKGEESQTAVQRWKSAERTVSALSEQVDRIEKEAREERVRHAEIVARLERRRVVKGELESAAGCLKGAAAADTTVGSRNGSSSVVSNFVKDILQDNVNLQMGIAELREMLSGSNEEVENLREQMILHQPVPSALENAEKLSLNSELMKTPTAEMPDFHVHHHYHAAPRGEAKGRAPTLRRPKKKRHATSPGFQTPGAGAQTPQLRATPAATAATILSQTSVTVPFAPRASAAHSHRWSLQSSQAPSSTVQSSAPSSPHSTCQDLSISDAGDETFISSRPTSPASTNSGSPDLHLLRFKREPDISMKSLAAQPTLLTPPTISGFLKGDEGAAFSILDQSTILEETEDERSRSSTMDTNRNLTSGKDYKSFQLMRPRLHRASSAESILSSRGMEMPKLQNKDSQLLSSLRASVGISNTFVEPITSSTSAVGKSSNGSRHYDSSSYNRLLLASTPSASTISTTQSTISSKSTLGKKLGGWMTGKWGVAPTTSSGDLRAKALLASIDTTRSSGVSEKRSKAVNRLSSQVEAVEVNSTLLDEALEGG